MSTAGDNRFYREKPTTPDDGGPAFPVEVGTRPVGQNWHQTGNDTAQHYGMSLRDHLAGLAMQGFCSRSDWIGEDLEDGLLAGTMARHAYRIADEMLKARQS